MFAIIQAAGWPIWPLLLASIIAVALIIERSVSLRHHKIVPPTLLEQVVSVYKRQGGNDFLTRFRIKANGKDELDRVTDSDGIDVASVSLGPGFKRGAFLAQDGSNQGANINFKLVPWHAIVEASDGVLTTDTTQKPRHR